MPTTATVLLLEDDDDRLAAFRSAVAALGPGFRLVVWHDAPTMIAECERYFPEAALVSLDHDLNPRPGHAGDPGTGLDVARHLGDFLPACPVLVHSSNTDRAYSMVNELRFAGWNVDRVGPFGNDWIATDWLRRIRGMLAAHANTWHADLPPGHAERVDRMRLSLDGLGLGDALGEMLAARCHRAPEFFAADLFPGGPWFHTDDGEMAIAVAGVLKSHGHVEQDALAKRFARRFERDPERGYGRMTRIQMRDIIEGKSWREGAANAFGGQGSMGNGSAMRVAPLGAYFVDDLERCAAEARLSSLVTHTHPEAVAGAIAVAVAAAVATRAGTEAKVCPADSMFAAVLAHTPESRVRRGLELAATLPADLPVAGVAKTLGNGSLISAPDTVPFCIWMAAHRLGDFPRALAETIAADGDCDTNAAIVGGIVAPFVGRAGIPASWLASRERVSL